MKLLLSVFAHFQCNFPEKWLTCLFWQTNLSYVFVKNHLAYIGEFIGKMFQAAKLTYFHIFDHRSLLQNIFFDICQTELPPTSGVSSDAGRWKTLEVPVVIGGDNLPSPVGIGLTDLPNIRGASSPPAPGPRSSGITECVILYVTYSPTYQRFQYINPVWICTMYIVLLYKSAHSCSSRWFGLRFVCASSVFWCSAYTSTKLLRIKCVVNTNKASQIEPGQCPSH